MQDPGEGEAALKKSRLEKIEEQALMETDVDKLGALYDEHKRLTKETQKDEDAEPPKRRKLEDIADEAMQAEDEDDLKRLYDEYRDEYTRKFIEDQMMEDEGDNEDPADNEWTSWGPCTTSARG